MVAPAGASGFRSCGCVLGRNQCLLFVASLVKRRDISGNMYDTVRILQVCNISDFVWFEFPKPLGQLSPITQQKHLRKIVHKRALVESLH